MFQKKFQFKNSRFLFTKFAFYQLYISFKIEFQIIFSVFENETLMSFESFSYNFISTVILY
jgi:hypothetical protein